MANSKKMLEERLDDMEKAFENGYNGVADWFKDLEVPGEESGSALHGALTALMVIAAQMTRDKSRVAPMVSMSLEQALKMLDPDDPISAEVWDLPDSSESVH